MALTKLDKNLLGFSDDTDFVKLPSGTTAQRPSSAAAGQFRFNTTIGDAEVYDGTAWTRMGTTPPTFSAIDYPGTATAANPAGGETVIITGTEFKIGVSLTIGGTTPSSITRNSSTQITFTAPAKSAGSYSIIITNTDGGTATATNAINYNGVPAFTNAAGSLGSLEEGGTFNFSVAATEPDGGAVTYAVTTGSLPAGASLNTSTGAITGTASNVNASTTSTFTITATDNENQSSTRQYSITVTNFDPSTVHGTTIYTGNGGSLNVTGLSFKPDIVWIYNREQSGQSPKIYDSSRGVHKYFYTNQGQTAQNISSGLQSFNNNGFTLGSESNSNANGIGHAAWCWKVNGGTTSTNSDGSNNSTVQVNQAQGISIIEYTTVGSNTATVGHGLGAEPDVVIYKNLDSTGAVHFYTTVIDGSMDYLTISNNTSAKSDSSTQAFTSSTVTMESGGSGQDYIAYAFKEKAGYSDFGTYTGTGVLDAPNPVVTGFEPAWVIIKVTDDSSAGAYWVLVDNKRETLNPRHKMARVGAGGDEWEGDTNSVTFHSNGFSVNGDYTSTNGSGKNYFYMAFAGPTSTATPVLSNSFDVQTYTGESNYSPKTVTYSFEPGLIFNKARNGGHSWGVVDSLTWEKGHYKNTDNNNQVYDGTGSNWDAVREITSTGAVMHAPCTWNCTNNYVSFAWKTGYRNGTINTDGSIKATVAANPAAGISVINYKGAGADATVGHGLSSAPEVVISKANTGGSGNNWAVWHKDLGGNNYGVFLDNNSARYTSGDFWNNIAPTSSVVNLGDGAESGSTNNSGRGYSMYCFHSVAGYSKFGSYTGSGSAGNAQTLGFAPGMIILKRIDAQSDWQVFDSVRGESSIVRLNTYNTEFSNTTFNFDSNGFSFDAADYNGSGQTWIYFAWAIN